MSYSLPSASWRSYWHCHGVGGAVGMVMTALLANVAVNGANTTGNGIFFGDTALFIVHMKALAIVISYTVAGSFLILKIVDLAFNLRVSAEDKRVGSDYAQHGEQAQPYELREAV